MKKIVAAAAAALLLAGAAFADVGFSWTGTGIVGGTSKALDKVTRNDCLALTVSDATNRVVNMTYYTNYKKITENLSTSSE